MLVNLSSHFQEHIILASVMVRDLKFHFVTFKIIVVVVIIVLNLDSLLLRIQLCRSS